MGQEQSILIQEFDGQTEGPGMGGMSTNSMFDNSDGLQQQILMKQKEIQMRTADGMRAKFLKQANQTSILENAGYPAGSVIDTEGLNAHQLEIRQMLLNPDNEYYHRTNDSVYDKFRATIRDREAFNQEVKQIKLTD